MKLKIFPHKMSSYMRNTDTSTGFDTKINVGRYLIFLKNFCTFTKSEKGAI